MEKLPFQQLLALAEDVVEIVRSLGGRAKIRSRNRVGKKNSLGSRVIETKKYHMNLT